ncbi:MAG: mycothiol conjugate amidase Mca [Acidimicrobiia bacterium]|nr:mycothiol conjugate amidase Mca [Acidimicrobiia bacterium]
MPQPVDWRWSPRPAEVDAAHRRLMAVHAHPDDEASKGAGTVAKLSESGVRATLVTCTGGEEGDILNPAMESHEIRLRLPEVRMRELTEASDVCGYAAVYLLGYRDSGMPDTDPNNRPDAFVNVDFEEALGRLVRIMRRERPHVVLGYDAHEAYPHPDHIMAHRLTMAAWDAAADPSFAPAGIEPAQLGEPWEIRKLYWFHWSHRRMVVLHEEFLRRGWESPFGEWLAHRADTDGAVTTRIDVAGQVGRAREALSAHRTQVDPDGFWLKLPEEVVARLHPYEEYVLVRNRTASEPTASNPEDDLLAGVT